MPLSFFRPRSGPKPEQEAAKAPPMRSQQPVSRAKDSFGQSSRGPRPVAQQRAQQQSKRTDCKAEGEPTWAPATSSRRNWKAQWSEYPQRADSESWAVCEANDSGPRRRSWGTVGNRTRRRREAAPGGYRFGEPEAMESLEDLQEQLEEAALQEQSLRDRLRALEHELAQKCGKDGEDWGHRKSQLRASIDSTAAAVQDLRKQRNSILCGDDPKVRQEQQNREEIKQFKASARYATEAQLDLRIKELETLMLETNLQLREERKLLGEIQGLGRQKEEVQEYRRREAALRSEDEIIKERLNETAEELTAKVEELNKAEAELKRLEQERELALASSPEAAERASVHHQLNEWLHWKGQLQRKIEQKERILARQRAEEEEARRREEAREEERQRRAEQQQRLRELREEREQQQKEARERREAALQKSAAAQARVPKQPMDDLPKEPPHFAELRLLEQTLAYCRKLLPKDDASSKEKKPIEYNNPEGSLVIMPKEDRPDEFLFAPPKPRRHEGKVRKRPPTSKMKKTRTEGKQVLMHTPLSLQLFAELQIVPPVNTCDVPPTVDEVEERLATRRQEMAKWEEKRKELRERWLATELEKARLAQEEREQERLCQLDRALRRLEERRRELEEDSEASESAGEALLSALRAAETLGATVSALAPAQAALRCWTRQRAEVDLLRAVERFTQAQRTLTETSASAEKASEPRLGGEEREEAERETPRESAENPELEQFSRELRLAAKELDGSLRSAKQADVASEHQEAALALLEAYRGKAAEEGVGASAEATPELAGADEDPPCDDSGDAGDTTQEADDFVPTILNLGDDEEEELVFDLGMG